MTPRPSLVASAAMQAAKGSNDLVPSALKGIALGFVGGVIAIVALMTWAPRYTHPNEPEGASQQASANHLEIK